MLPKKLNPDCIQNRFNDWLNVVLDIKISWFDVINKEIIPVLIRQSINVIKIQLDINLISNWYQVDIQFDIQLTLT